MFLDDLVTPVLGVSVDLEETLDLDRGRAWVGFTATTGGGWQNHDILSWQFTSLADTTPVIVASDVEVLEGDSGQSNANFDVTVTRPDDSDPLTVTVDYATADDTATAGSDYLSANGSLVFELSVGQTEMTKTVSVPINGDLLLEDSEQFTLNLSNVQAATIAVSPGTATIVTDDISVSIEDVQVVEGELQGVFMDVFAPVSGITGAMDLPRDFAFHDTDGFLYATSAASNEILRYDGETGEFHDIFYLRRNGEAQPPNCRGFRSP